LVRGAPGKHQIYEKTIVEFEGLGEYAWSPGLDVLVIPNLGRKPADLTSTAKEVYKSCQVIGPRVMERQ
jgi:hypothetical protein